MVGDVVIERILYILWELSVYMSILCLIKSSNPTERVWPRERRGLTPFVELSGDEFTGSELPLFLVFFVLV